MKVERHERVSRRADGRSRRQIRTVAIILFCVLVEAFCLHELVHLNIWPYNRWLTQTVSAVAEGRPVPPDNSGPIDYRMLWSVGRMAEQGRAAQAYDYPTLLKFEEKTRSKSSPWIYPPTVIPLTFFTFIASFGAGFLLWTIFLSLLSCWILRSASVPWTIIAATIVSPAALWSDTLGQFGLISGSLLVASLLSASRRPVRAGIFAGFLTMKPQIGLLLPVVFLARRNIRAIVAATLVFLGLVAVSLLLFGAGAWHAYLTSGLAMAHAILVKIKGNFGLYGGISVFWSARTLGLGVPESYGLQVMAALGAMIWCWRAWRDPQAAPLPRVALTMCLATFISPYGYVYDLCAYSVGIALLAWDRGKLTATDVLLWAVPIPAYILSIVFHVLVTPAIILLAAFCARRQMRRNGAGRAPEQFAVQASA